MLHVPHDQISPCDRLSGTAAATDVAAEPQQLVFLSKAQVLKKVPVTAPTLWTWVRAGKFPRPRAISANKTCWLAHEVDEWIRAQPVRSYKP